VAVAVVLVTDDNGSGQVIGDSQITKKYFFKVQKVQIASKSVKQVHKYNNKKVLIKGDFISVLLSTKFKRFSVSCIHDFFFVHNQNFYSFLGEILVL
jgi:hypothetical protein